MKIRELFEGRSLPNENSNGRAIAHNTEALRNFWVWFKGSKVVDSKGRPMVMYHGTNADVAKFGYKFADVGVSALGMGFYFTNMPNTASGYARDDKPGGNVIPVYLNIKKPVASNSTHRLSREQIKRIILASPILEDALSNFGDIDYYGKAKVFKDAVTSYDECCTQFLHQLDYIANDFFNGHEEAFLTALVSVTGFDGVVHPFDSGEVFYVAWSNTQAASAVGAKGSYKGDDLVTEQD